MSRGKKLGTDSGYREGVDLVRLQVGHWLLVLRLFICSEKDARKLWSMIFPLSESFNKMFEIFNNALERTVKRGEENLEESELVKLIMKNTTKLESYLQVCRCPA